MTGPAFQADDIPLLIAITVDCNDLDGMATFWSELLGLEIRHSDDQFAFLSYAPDRKVTLWLQKVDEPRVGKNRLHLDFAVPDLEATERRVVALGGSLGDMHDWEGNVWRVCADPEGNLFDVMIAPPPPEEAVAAG